MKFREKSLKTIPCLRTGDIVEANWGDGLFVMKITGRSRTFWSSEVHVEGIVLQSGSSFLQVGKSMSFCTTWINKINKKKLPKPFLNF